MKNIFSIFKRRNKKAQTNNPDMQMVLRSVSMTEEDEISCDDVFNLLDQFAEMIERGEDAAQLMPLVQKHLDLCPDCREEYESLTQMMNIPFENENRRK